MSGVERFGPLSPVVPAKFEKTMAALTAKSAELETAEERWLELEMLREEAGG